MSSPSVPAYQQLNSVPKAIGCDVTLWKLREENDFQYDRR